MHPSPYPEACVLCCHFMLPEDAQPAAVFSPGVGHICHECSDHLVDATRLLWSTKGIAWHMIPDDDRNDIFPPVFLRFPSKKKES